MCYALGLSWLPHLFPKIYVKRLRTAVDVAVGAATGDADRQLGALATAEVRELVGGQAGVKLEVRVMLARRW